MSEQVVIPNAALPTAEPAPAAPAIPAEIAYLKQHGGENADTLHAELESLLKGQQAPQTAVEPTAAPITQPAPTPVSEPAAPQQQPQQQPAPQTAMEKALDPYAPEGAEAEDGADGVEGVVIDAEGRARDARTGKYVPIKALHHERSKVKNLHEENAKLREMQARAEERLAVLNEFLEKSSTPEPTPEAAPVVEEELADPEVDIFKWAKQMKARDERKEAYIKQLEEKISGSEQKTSAQIEELAAQQILSRDVNSFAAKHPDLSKAYDHMKAARDRQLVALGFKDAAERTKQIEREEKILQVTAIRNKQSYAETIYNLAQTYGYQPPAAAESNANPLPTPPAAAPAPAAIPAPATPSPTMPAVDPAAAAKVEAIRNGQHLAAPTLNGQGGSGGEGLTVARLASMTEAEFLDLAAKMGGKGKLDQYFRGI